ncbi:YjcZ family sporulation protein [Anaerobacillus isosaccharinicus]|uniref:YjcZ family sporulation protein n=1 Tax=Anaerobacillus isosaccharinicus TaxID=1532552 RepID=A0A7S7L707_9BACI|nr:YjcZ family sporulation protein [Anaerobacillus isosaccharinicus]MBA5586155.1 YjcZ family sporulation protein [Anaerobacillus isosaccharinicus]QOY35580.1 YjcZ family sporulation protein [Anaerobacillus isosaccharinicus]
MYHYGAPQQFQGYPSAHGTGRSFTLIVVLFILLVVVGSAYLK